MANRIATHILKNSNVLNRTLPSTIFQGEPLVNTADGIVYFSGNSASTSGWTPAGTNTGFFEVGSNLYDLKLRNRITKYEGFEGASLVGKFLSGTTSGFTLANISSILGVDTYVTGFTYSPTTNTITLSQNIGQPDRTVTITSMTGLSITGTLSATTILTPSVNINSNGITATTISATTYQNVAHNSTTGLQGGSPGEYYHLTASQQTRVLNLIYSGQVTTFSIAPTTAERGVSTSVTATYRMIAGDDIYTGATINPLGYVLYPNFTDGVTRTTGFTQAASASTTTYTLNYGFTRNGVGTAATATASFTTYLPQWYGVNAAFSAATNYSAVNALSLTKLVQPSASITTTAITATNQYIWFISNKTNAIITASGFGLNISALNVEDGVSDMYQKSFNLTLADGVTVGTLYTYISRQPKTITGIIYTIA